MLHSTAVEARPKMSSLEGCDGDGIHLYSCPRPHIITHQIICSRQQRYCTRALDAKQNGVATLTKASRTMINWIMYKSCICICWANFIYRTRCLQYKHFCQACVFVYCNHMKMAIQYILPDARRLLGGLRGTGTDYIIAHLRRLD